SRVRMGGTAQGEECDSGAAQRGHNEGSVEEVVVLLARGFRDKEATVTGRALEEPALVGVLWRVLCTHRIVGAESPELQCRAQVAVNLATGLHQPAEGSLRVGRTRIEEDAVARASGIDALADRARRIATLESHCGDQQ